MKRSFLIAAGLFPIVAFAQTTTLNNLVVNGLSNFFGPVSLQNSASAVTPPFGDNSTAVPTTSFVARHAPCPSIMDHGGDNTGTNDNSSAFLNTINAQPVGRACVFFPSGTYEFSGIVSYTLPDANSSFTVLGSGESSTNLVWNNGGGLQIVMPGGTNNSAHIRDLSFLNGSPGTGNAAIALINQTASEAPVPTVISDITNVSIHGSDGFAQNNYWQQGIYTASWSNINFTGVTVIGSAHGGDFAGYAGQGLGIDFTGSSGNGSAPQGVQYNIAGCQFNYLQAGVQYNDWIQGLSISQTNFTGGKFGIHVTPPNQGQDQLIVTGSQFNDSAYGIWDEAGIPGLVISNNYFLIPTPTSNNAAVFLTDVYTAAISNNHFQRIGASANGTNGVAIGKNNYAGAVISGNTFTGLGTGIFLQNSSSANSVQSNLYHANGTNIVNQGAGNIIGGGAP